MSAPPPPLQQPTPDRGDLPPWGGAAVPAPPLSFDALRSNVDRANLVYAQLQAERVEAERMENSALVALKEAQAAFDRRVQEFRDSFPGSSLWGR